MKCMLCQTELMDTEETVRCIICRAIIYGKEPNKIKESVVVQKLTPELIEKEKLNEARNIERGKGRYTCWKEREGYC